MAQVNTKDFSTLPVGILGLIPLQSCSSLGAKVNDWLVKWRAERQYPGMDSFAFEGYKRDSYIIDAKTPRFGSGEGKCTINESVRGDDIYVMVDVTNYSLSYPIGPYTNLMSPDDHFQDMKRVIAAVGGKARRVNVIMPYLYESRQDKRVGRESLDCANALHELIDMGVENIITFDAHDSRVQNATPLHGFETVQPSYQFIKALLKNEKIDALLLIGLAHAIPFHADGLCILNINTLLFTPGPECRHLLARHVIEVAEVTPHVDAEEIVDAFGECLLGMTVKEVISLWAL